MITQRYNLNLIPDRVPVIVNCSQYDTLSRTIEMVIYDGSVLYTIPSGTTATVRGTKSDNTGFEYTCTISDSIVSFDIQDQMTIYSGKVPCEIRFINSNGIIGTCNFLLNVEETPLDPDITISESDLPLLERAEQNAIRSEDAADRSEEEADRAEAEADRAAAAVANAVKSVNGELPDSNGNVDIVALPDGGTTGQYLVKQSSTDGDADWQTLPTFVQTVNNVAPTGGNVDVEALPTGGTQGQVLTKQSSTDGDADWEDIDALPSGGTVGQVLTKLSSTDGDASWQTPSSGGTTVYDDSTAYSSLTFETLSSGVDTVKLGIDMDLLWTNSSPTSSFSAQTISLDLSEYRAVLLILVMEATASTIYYNPLLCLVNGNNYRAVNGGSKIMHRSFNVSTSGISVLGGYLVNSYGADTADNVRQVPIYIYGIR